jgi:hypothetical protein
MRTPHASVWPFPPGIYRFPACNKPSQAIFPSSVARFSSENPDKVYPCKVLRQQKKSCRTSSPIQSQTVTCIYTHTLSGWALFIHPLLLFESVTLWARARQPNRTDVRQKETVKVKIKLILITLLVLSMETLVEYEEEEEVHKMRNL